MNLAGKLLIAPPALKGNFWHKTTILITEHHALGSTGLVLNKPSTTTVSDFGAQLGFRIDAPGFVHIGGPVNNKNLSFLHTNEWVSTNTMRINDEFSLSSAEDIVPRLAIGDRPHRWRIFLGLCGWGPNQLLSEIKGIEPWHPNTSWLTANADLDLVFGLNEKDQWCKAVDHCSLEFAQNILT